MKIKVRSSKIKVKSRTHKEEYGKKVSQIAPIRASNRSARAASSTPPPLLTPPPLPPPPPPLKLPPTARPVEEVLSRPLGQASICLMLTEATAAKFII